MMKKKNSYLPRESTVLPADVMDTDLQRKFNAFRIRIQSREVLVNIQFDIRCCCLLVFIITLVIFGEYNYW